MAKERILAVDDEEDILELVRFNLAREGYPVICAISGEETLKMARTEHPDLILLDLMLPDIDGKFFRVVARAGAKGSLPDTPVALGERVAGRVAEKKEPHY